MKNASMLMAQAALNIDPSGLTVTEGTFRKVLWAVTSCTLEPGSIVTEEGLAAELEVSRTPMRDALRRLETLGLILRRTNRTLQVAPLSVEEMWDLSLTREALETLIVRQIANQNRDGKISLVRLETIHAQMTGLAALHDNAPFLASGLEFHGELFRLGQVPTATVFLDQIMVRLQRYRRLMNEDDRRPGHIVEEHELVLKALRRGDAKSAEAAVRDHLAQARTAYLNKLAPQEKAAG